MARKWNPRDITDTLEFREWSEISKCDALNGHVNLSFTSASDKMVSSTHVSGKKGARVLLPILGILWYERGVCVWGVYS